MRILFALMVPGLLAVAACGSPFLSEIGPADAQDPVEAGRGDDHRVGARHEAGADHDAGEHRESGARDRAIPDSDGGVDVVAIDAGDAGDELVVTLEAGDDGGLDAPALDAGDDVEVADASDAGATDAFVDAGLDVAALDGGADVGTLDAGAPDVVTLDAGVDSSLPDAAPDVVADVAVDVVVDAGAPDVGPVDAGPVDTGVDSACITPFDYSCSGGGLVASAPSQVCIYDEYFVAYSLGTVPYACQCASTFTCGCLSYYGLAVCGGRSWSFCVDTGGGPQVTCD